MTLPESPTAASLTSVATATRRSRRSRLATVALAAVCLVSTLALGAPSASANPAGPHDPIGAIDKVTANPDGSMQVVGWAADPDSTANVTLYGVTDGKRRSSAVTSVANSTIVGKHHTGPTPGFDFSVPVPTTGVHTMCVFAHNIGAGLGRILGCVTTPLGTKLTTAQKNTHSPRGVVTTATATTTTLRVTGWAVDPDFRAARVAVVLYLDGTAVRTVATHRSAAAQRTAGAGKNGAFSISAPVTSGAHLGCVWLVNAGFGSNTTLGCTAVDTRGAAGTGPVSEPAVNAKVVKEAKRHIGQPYVWGAEGPKKFDCSGLVMYSYHKAGLTTPRIAADQFAAARVIPAARAVPGDLVFYHDSVGAVYHVGIYLSPGLTVAAIDEQEGVAHQPIWDPSSASYGSFTHT